MGEAVGQLAAWQAMRETDFELRPMAGLAAKVRMIGHAEPGDKLSLIAEISGLSSQAISYSGQALVDGEPILSLEGCVGPMLPVEQFDDAGLLEKRFRSLIEGTSAIGGFDGIPEPKIEILSERDKGLEAVLYVPDSAPYFEDHFPRMPVLPGTLQIFAQDKIVRSIAARFADGPLKATEINSSKLRAFIPPGSEVEVDAKLQTFQGQPEVSIQMQLEGRVVGSARWNLVRSSE